MSPPRKVRLSLSTQVMLGLVLGMWGRDMFGESVASLQHVGKAFMFLLQMPCCPTLPCR